MVSFAILEPVFQFAALQRFLDLRSSVLLYYLCKLDHVVQVLNSHVLVVKGERSTVFVLFFVGLNQLEESLAHEREDFFGDFENLPVAVDLGGHLFRYF